MELFYFVVDFVVISTHAPLAGRDKIVPCVTSPQEISTHAPLAGRDWETCAYTARYIIFQPTRPLRGATRNNKRVLQILIAISTHAPLAGRDQNTSALDG